MTSVHEIVASDGLALVEPQIVLLYESIFGGTDFCIPVSIMETASRWQMLALAGVVHRVRCGAVTPRPSVS